MEKPINTFLYVKLPPHFGIFFLYVWITNKKKLLLHQYSRFSRVFSFFFLTSLLYLRLHILYSEEKSTRLKRICDMHINLTFITVFFLRFFFFVYLENWVLVIEEEVFYMICLKDIQIMFIIWGLGDVILYDLLKKNWNRFFLFLHNFNAKHV